MSRARQAAEELSRRGIVSPPPTPLTPAHIPPPRPGPGGPAIIQPPPGDTMAFGEFGGITIGPGGISGTGTIGGIPISATLPFGGGGSEAPSGDSLVPGGGGDCPGIWSVRGPDGTCIDILALPPGGDPAVTGAVQTAGGSDGYGPAVRGLYGVGIQPRVEAQTVRRCPPGTALGKDGVCYEGLHRNSPKRAWPMGMKPLMTGGDRAAIRKAASAAAKLGRAKKTLSKASKALGKVC